MVLAIVFSSCEKNDLFSPFDFPDLKSNTGSLAEAEEATAWFGPEIFKVGKKAPVIYRRTLDGIVPGEYTDFVLVAQNGTGGRNRVTKLEISLNGARVVTSAGFRSNPGVITRTLDDLTAGSVLEIKLHGPKGRFVTVWIEAVAVNLTVSDIEGNIYKTVRIGSQTWMAENLRTTKFTDGTTIRNVTGAAEWTATVNASIEAAYCWYNNDVSNKSTYGALYNTYALSMGAYDDTSGQLCPDGWHVPSSADWQKLVLTLDPDAIEGANPMSETAGVKLKEAGLVHWESPNAGATNESGFTALPGGYREEDGTFIGISLCAFFWADNGYSARDLGYDHTLVMFRETSNAYGYSVRCVKDED